MSSHIKPRHRGISVVSAFALLASSMAGLGVLTLSASAPAEATQIVSPVVPSPTTSVAKKVYYLAADDIGNEYYYDAIRPIAQGGLGMSEKTAQEYVYSQVAQALSLAVQGRHGSSGSSFSGTTILAGDDITFVGGIAAGTTMGEGAPARYVWSPNVHDDATKDYYGIALLQDDFKPTAIDFENYGPVATPGNLSTCVADPGLGAYDLNNENPISMIGSYCEGPAMYQMIIKNSPPSHTLYDDRGPMFSWRTQILPQFYSDFAPESSTVSNVLGMFDSEGANPNSFGNLAVLNPQLKLIKQVCSTGVGCIGDQGEDLGGWVNDDTYGDDNVGDGSVPTGINPSLGVPSGVERALLGPSNNGTDTIQWKLTAANMGNVSLFDVHVAVDNLNIERGASGRTLTPKTLASGAADPNANTCQGRAFGSTDVNPLTPFDAEHNNDPANYTLSVLCQTQFNESLEGFDGTVQNTAALNASLPAGWLVPNAQQPVGTRVIPMQTTPVRNITKLPDGTTYTGAKYTWMSFIDPAGTPLSERFSGYGADGRSTIQGLVPSNIDSAQVVVASPQIKVTKWVCSTGTGCLLPTSSADQRALAGYDEANHVMLPSSEARGWVKSTTVPYDGTVQWLAVITNTGNDYLNDLKMTDTATINLAEADGGPKSLDTALAVTAAQTQMRDSLGPTLRLAPFKSTFVTYTMSHVTATGGPDVGWVEGTASPASKMEREYIAGTDLVNAVSVTGTPVYADDRPIPDPSTESGEMAPVTSNISIAEVNTASPDPLLKVTKWVCSTGTGCASPTAAQLSTLSGVDPTGAAAVKEGQPLTDTGGWQKAGTVVPYDNVADWLIVAANIGNTPLKIDPSKIDDQINEGGHGVSTQISYDTNRVLLPNESMVLTRSTRDISNLMPNNTTKTSVLHQASKEYGYQIATLDEETGIGPDIVNEVQITPTPTDKDGTPLPKQNTYVVLTNGVPDEQMTAPPSNWSYAEVNATPPNAKLKATKWVCTRAHQNCDIDAATLDKLAGIERSGKEFTVRTGAAAGGWDKENPELPYGADAKWLVVAANIGSSHLVKVTLDDLAPGAGTPGHGATTLQGDSEIPNYIMPPGGVAYFQLSTAKVTNATPVTPNATGATLVVDTQEVTDEQAQTDVGVTESADAAMLAIVNQAKVKGTPAHPDGTILAQPGYDTDENETPRPGMDPIWSNLSTAEVSTVPPEPKIRLTKWVCEEGDQCISADKLTRPQIQALSDPESNGAFGWVKATTVFPYGADAPWLLVATNVGEIDLGDVSVEYEYVANDETTDIGTDTTVPVGCEEGARFDLSDPAYGGKLAPWRSVVIACSSPYITNTNPLGSDEAVINTAKVQGIGLDSDGQYLPAPGGADGYITAHSDFAEARANTIMSDTSMSLAKWVCQDAPCTILTDDLEALADKDNANPPGGWVDDTEVAYSASATWLIVVKNIGNEYMKDVQMYDDFLTKAGKPVEGVPTGCEIGTLFTDHLVAPGEIVHLTCSTATVVNTDAPLVNTAQAAGIPTNSRGTMINEPSPDGPYYDLVPTNTDPASVIAKPVKPELTLAKWVCSNGTNCPDTWDDIPDSEHPILSNPASAPTPSQASGWVNRDQVPYTSTVKWLVVVTNTGETDLADVHLTTESLSPALPGNCLASGMPQQDLARGEAILYTCTTTSMNYVDGDLVNTAKASGQPVDDDGEKLPGPDGKDYPPVDSNEDTAEVFTEPPVTGIELAKWVCAAGTGCRDWDHISLVSQRQLKNPATKWSIGDAPIAGWVKATEVEYGADADWMIVITNTGDLPLKDIEFVVESVTGTTETTTGCAQGPTSVALLAAKASTAVTCTTPKIANQQPLGSGNDVVNTAQAKGTPVLEDGVTKVPRPYGRSEDPADPVSDPDSAEVRTDVPAPNIDIRKYDILDGDDSETGHYPYADNPKQLEPNFPTPIMLTITNTGTEDLINVVVSDALTAGYGQVTGLTCNFQGRAHGLRWVGPFAPNTSFDCNGTVPGLSDGQTHTNTARVDAIGEYTGESVWDDDPWNGAATVIPNISITKYDTLDGDDMVSGHHPETAKDLKAGVPTPISIYIRNNGTDTLSHIEVTDKLVAGSGALTGLTCEFPSGGSHTATTWTGPFLPGSSFTCTGTVPALEAGQTHTNESTVSGYGTWTGQRLTKPDTWKGRTPPPPDTPLVEIEKYDTLNGDNAITGHHPNPANPKKLAAGTPTPINFTITNRGTDNLVNVVVTDQLTAGSGAITGLTCDFPSGGTRTATTWSGPFVVGASFGCTGTVPALNAGQSHSDKATVTAEGVTNKKPVTDDDDWNGEVPPDPSISLTKYDTLNGDNATTGHHPDPAQPKTLEAGKPTPISLTITNNGSDDLIDIVVSDRLTAGSGAITGLTCSFPSGGTRTATTWSGPFAVGASFDCTGTVPALNGGQSHSDKATVTAKGATDKKPVTEDDDWNGDVPPGPNISLVKYDTLDGDNATTGRHPNAASPKHLAVDTETPISLTITNDGTDALIDIVVTDQLTSGSGAITGLTCDFPSGGTRTATTWSGPLAVGASFDCTGTVPGLADGQTHSDKATVTAKGATNKEPVTDDDDWNGDVPKEPFVEPGVPDVDILKYDTLNGDDRVTGRFPDSANPKKLAAGVETPISFTVTNTGTEDLINVIVTDETVAGTNGKITGLTCDFSKAGGPTSGTTWDGPFPVNASFTCKGTLPGLAAGQLHTDIATVTGTGKVSGQTPTSSDKWNGKVPPSVITPAGGTVLADSSVSWGGSLSLVALLAIMLMSAAMKIVHRRAVR